jgi:DNA repair protein RecN (Recombination protein N)
VDLADAVGRLRAADAALQRLAEAARDRERELDLLAYQVGEIDAVGPRPDETSALGSEEARLGHAERLQELASSAEMLLNGERGVGDVVAEASATLEAIAALDPDAGGLATRGAGLAAEVVELGREVRTYREALVVDPVRLQEVRERIAALKSLHRKYGETDAEVLAFGERAAKQVEALRGADERLAELLAASASAREGAESLARRVTAGRLAAAPELAAALTHEIRDLGMPAATIQVALEPLDRLAPQGAERVELRLAAGEGQASQPLSRAASGGELSRVMLACRSVLADLDAVPTLIFDEVDTGIGGQAGLAVGRRLARLAEHRQVLVVTHLPQIASFADRHVRLRKERGVATAAVLDRPARVRELSRMLAGLEGSEHAASHAEELLAAAATATRPGA